MTVTRAIAGEQFKLYSPKETLLGIITLPAWAGEQLREYHVVQMAWTPRMLARGFRPEADAAAFVEVTRCLLTRARCDPNGVELWGVTLEQFEQMQGCSFSPSAAYLRSLVE